VSKELLVELRQKRKVYGSGKRDRPLGKSTGMLSMHAGMQRGMTTHT